MFQVNIIIFHEVIHDLRVNGQLPRRETRERETRERDERDEREMKLTLTLPGKVRQG